MQKFEIQNRNGLNIIGYINIPQNPKGLSFVLHGLGGYKEELHIKILSDTLFENSYVVVVFDATNSRGESDGKYEEATFQKHYNDLVDVINWSKTQDWYREPFILAGHSMGGFAVAKYAEEFSKEVKAVFPFAGLFSGEDSFKIYKKFKPEEIKDWEEKGFVYRISRSKPGFEMKLPWSHMEERLKHDLILTSGKITMPILFVVGENDMSCPPEHQKRFYNSISPEVDKEIHIIKGAEHVFREKKELDQLKEIFDKWLKKLE